jgi:hypothetical protein
MSVNSIYQHICIRKHKKGLYHELLRKGFDNLTDTEKEILRHLSIDKDIQILLINGHVFGEEKNE